MPNLISIITGFILTFNVQGAIIPHHDLVHDKIDLTYKILSVTNDYEKVIILSPDHFEHGQGYISSNNYEKEHGITIHIPYLKKYFPEADIEQFMFAREIPKKTLDNFIEQINRRNLSKTLIIASLDFSHYDNENNALITDGEIIKYLNTSHKKINYSEIKRLAKGINPDLSYETSIDSPEVFYVFTRLMNDYNFYFLDRTSAFQLNPNLQDRNNTSHIYGAFGNLKLHLQPF
ncbi:AmmeMemoRadiSam system protein B [Candidatus Peregrinibacteria bacterium]|nr:AmmeMemoRadiSam system protein B [Candidatus Peregrinibacteria bacterium]